MIIGVPKEIKKEEYRVGMTPFGADELKKDGHTILIETGAGEGSGFSDDEYLKADADIVDRRTVFNKSDLIVKVKEPLPPEFDLIVEGQAIFAYLHLSPNPELTGLLLRKKVTSLGYETLEKDGTLPLLTPMSEIAGRMAPLMGAYFLQKIHGGEGILPTGAIGVKPAHALILGAGVVGSNAARVSIGIGMETSVMNRGIERLQRLDEVFSGRIRTLPLTEYNIREEIRNADIVVGAVLVPGGRTPILIMRDMLKTMKKGAVIVDVSVDQGGSVETSRATSHDNPVYEVDGIIHYAVANMPGAYPRTSTLALTNATLPYIKEMARRGIEDAVGGDAVIMSSLNTYRGHIVHKALAESIGATYKGIGEITR
ncbi:MAG TPA: alanine dehydrogenase [Thermodesulfovibrionales bacterium]|nr:alanine dehydrogenase [Thermodesulfovibrionales bacterium]